MKKIRVIVKAELEVPDSWEVVEHADERTAIQIGGTYYDFDLICYSTDSDEEDVDWMEDNEGTDKILGHIKESNTVILEV
jgi:hypothetical protein